MIWSEILAELIRRATSDLPADVEAALRTAAASEQPQSQAALFLTALTENAALARKKSVPMCQDTGTLNFFWSVPRGTDESVFEQAARAATERATREGWLRRNTLDGLTGRSIDSNVAEGCPVCHFEQRSESGGQRSEAVEVWLLQKGGGCENMSRQFSLPDDSLLAGRDLEGVRRCLLQAVWEAQGYGCAPGILGVCVGADRAEGFRVAKRQLLRTLDDSAAEPALAELERRVLAEANLLGVGPMGTGGNTTLLGVKVAARPRLPASYFVTVAYMCWACRRRGVRVCGDKVEWLG
ncbi:MAG: fumarate hydratase [Kiritimatiellae bacterium]|nr:fumarate hydratase [Kiritimatiellia bacterium]